MSENERPPGRRQNLHLVKDDLKDAAIMLMEALIQRANADEITILSVTEHESLPGPKRHLEIAYVDTAGVKQ